MPLWSSTISKKKFRIFSDGQYFSEERKSFNYLPSTASKINVLEISGAENILILRRSQFCFLVFTVSFCGRKKLSEACFNMPVFVSENIS